MYNLVIELQSSASVGSGGPGPGYVDRDVVFDNSALPYIPARRVKGLLRDAFRDVASTLALQGSKLDLEGVEEKLFGEIGAQSPGALRFRNALICVAPGSKPEPRLADWLAAVIDHGMTRNNKQLGILHREEVLGVYTEIRRQTRIERKTGTAAENTLRVTRSLRPGFRFSAEIGSAEQLSVGAEQLLALSAAALQQMGSSRMRGLGRVRCSLWRDDSDLTPDALKVLRADAFGPVQIAGTASEQRPVHVPPGSSTGSLRFRLTLTQPALFPTLSGDPNMVASLDYIPGATLQGWLAWKFLAVHPADDTFLSLFCRGRLNFLPAYPEIPDFNTKGPTRAVPVPFVLRKTKDKENTFRNLLAPDADWSEVRRIEDKWTIPGDAFFRGELRASEISKELQYHHWRPPDDRRIGRAVGAEHGGDFGLEKGKEGSVFTYEQIRPGASFIGVIQGDREALEHLRTSLGDAPPEVVLGRSRSGQYGGAARWEWLPESKNDAADLGSMAEFGTSNEILALALTPILVVNANGHPAGEFPLAQFQSVSGLPVQTLNAVFARTEWIGGYFSHQRLPRQQLPAIEPGSVFQLRLSRDCKPEEFHAAASRISATGFGLRTQQGYGRIAIMPCPDRKEGSLVEYNPPLPDIDVLVEPGSVEWGLALGIYKQRLEKKVKDDALTDAFGMQTRSLTPGLLFRLVDIVEGNFGNLRRELGRLRRRARDRIESCRTSRTPFRGQSQPNRSLEDFILDVAEQPGKHYQAVLNKTYQGQGWDQVFGRSNPLANDMAFCNQLMTRYVTNVLNGLAWRVREQRRKGQGGRA